MRRLSYLPLLLLFVGCIGQVGEPTVGDDDDQPPTPTGKMGRKLWTSDVHPIMARCAGAACHNIDAVAANLSHYYSPDANISYDAAAATPALVSTFSSIAPILTKVTAGHQGLSYTPDEQSKITNWLSVETNERKDTTQPPPPDPKILLKEWSGCMSLANFATAKMALIWGALAASNNQACVNCHQGGADGFMVNKTEAVYFKAITEYSALLLKYFTVDTQANKVVINTGSFMNAGVTIANHPRFDPALTPNAMPALKSFYDLTLARKTAGQCDPGRLLD